MHTALDIVIKNARIIDGTGNPYYSGDIGIANSLIERIGSDIPASDARKVINAEGQVACPGFFDTHSHDDAYLLKVPTGNHKILQGVTTDVVGNCGFTLGPTPPDPVDYLSKIAQLMGGGDMPESVFQISTFNDYLELLESVGLGINVVPLVGHATIRIAVIGWENRAPNPDELNRMASLAEEAMQAGAFGLSNGLIYVPANFAETREVTALAKVAAKYHGIYTTHMRSEGDRQMEAIAEAIRIGRDASLPVHISHHKVVGRNNWGQSVETLRRFAQARAEGVEVTCDQYPYPAGSTILAAVLPPAVTSGGPDVYAEKLKHPDFRREVIDIIENDDKGQWENLIRGAGFENIVISFARKNKQYIGKSLAQIAAEESRQAYDVLFDLVSEEKLDVGIILFMMDEEDIQRIMKSPYTMIGSDGIPGFGESKIHPRQTGTFPRILGRYVREKGVLSLEEAIRKMTSLPAQTFKVKNKGLLEEGYDADIVIFDPDTIIDGSTFEEPMQAPEGISLVLVNGQVAVKDGEITGVSSGRVLRHFV
jgi:N-acyl-D-amino-acid deacylase